MGEKVLKLSRALQILCALSVLVILCMPVRAQGADDESKQDKAADETGNDTKFHLYTDMGLEYLDNVYQLPDDKIQRMADNLQEDQTSGRFKNMDSAGDFIAQPTVGLKYAANSILGGDFALTSWVKYNYYMENDQSGFPEGRIRVRNTIGEHGALTFQGDFVSDYFKRNYLSDVSDLNDNGNISDDERVYSAAFYDEHKGTMAYDYQIFENKDGKLSGVGVKPFLGMEKRTYNSIFSNRDKSTTFAGLGVTCEFISKIDLEMIFQHETVATPNHGELILYDETIADMDVNGDGEIKGNAPLWTTIDRSCSVNSLEINPAFKLTKKIRVSLGYKRSEVDYESDNSLDKDHFDNTAYREQIKSEIECDFLKDWSARFEYRRINDNDDEDGDYLQNYFMVAIKYDFL